MTTPQPITADEADLDDLSIEVLTDKEAIVSSNRSLMTRPSLDRGGLAVYILLPLIFLAVTLLGGLRFAASDNAFIFLKPPLVALVFATLLSVQFVRSGLIDIDGWLGGERTLIENAANAGLLATLFAATVQIFNSLLPEQGLAFWVVSFCFLWTLWTNMFAAPDAGKLLKTTGAAFALAFAVKYLVLANLTAPEAGSWWQRVMENPGKEAFTYLLDLPRFSAATGYAQFFALSFYLVGLFLTPSRASR